jgi:hypothetical protein
MMTQALAQELANSIVAQALERPANAAVFQDAHFEFARA